MAVVIGYAIFRGGVRINLARFFGITGIVLVVIAAGLVMTSVHTANEAGWLNVGQQQAANLSRLVRPGTPISSLVTGVLGLQPFPTHIELTAWVVYLVPMLVLVSWPARKRQGGRRPSRAVATSPDPTSSPTTASPAITAGSPISSRITTGSPFPGGQPS